MSSNLTAEQLRRIEENRRRALAKRAQAAGLNHVPDSYQNSNINQTSLGDPAPSSSRGNAGVKTLPTGGISEQENRISSRTGHSDIYRKNNAHESFGEVINSTPAFSRQNRCDRNMKESKCDAVDGIVPPKVRESVPCSEPIAQTSQVVKPVSCHSQHNQLGTKHADSASLTNKTVIDYDKIEQNRLKALAKRAEKLNKSPVKISSTPDSNSQHDLYSVPVGGLTNPNIEVSSNDDRTMQSATARMTISTSKQDTLASSCPPDSGQNIFQGFSGAPVKGGCFLVSRDRFEVKAKYSAPLIQLFKTMETRLYDAVTKKWTFKLSEYNKFMLSVKHLKPAVDIDPLPKAILTIFGAMIRGDNPPDHVPIADLSKVEQSLVNSLMPFQREGVNFGIHKNGRVLIADDMGLGKTIQAICLACVYRSEWPLLVVVPSSVRFDWAQNFQRWVPSLDPQSVNVVVTGKDSCTSGLINILSYDLMARQATPLKNKRFQIIIMDECHLLKNYKTARCKAAMPLLQNARRVLLLSGTPALSRPSELYTQIIAVSPFQFGSFHDFGVRYCDGKQLPWGWDYSGSSNMEELQILLSEKIMIRRLKKDVLTELPDKIRQMILLDPSSIKINKELKLASNIMNSGNLKKMEERGALLDFFHKSGTAKMKAIKSYVEDLLESEKKFLIFAHHGDVLDGIEETVKDKIKNKYIRIDGKTVSEQRNVFCERFQVKEDIKVAILSITAANAGLNLSSANLVVFAELFWNPGILVQAEDRAHRIGQQDMVSVQYLVARGTSDDHIWPMIQKKLDVLGKAGLTKDNFASAETTRLTDQRQEEITKFLEESFCDESFTNDDADPCMSGLDADFSSPKKELKQASILKYASPMKITEDSACAGNTPPKQKKPKGLFKFFSPEKQVENKPNNSDSCTGMDNNDRDLTSASCVTGLFEGHSEEDLEEFLKDTNDEWDDREPVIKKRKT